jgi:hypothetical protein
MKVISALMVTVAFATVAPVVHASTVERTFTFPAHRLTLSEHGGLTHLEYDGGVPETRAGRPDLPSVSERVEIPIDMKAVGIEVLSVDTELAAAKVRLPSAIKPTPGLGVVERSAADPRYFTAGVQPERVAELGHQGFERGRKFAYVLVSPVRWDAASGRSASCPNGRTAQSPPRRRCPRPA